MFKYTETVYVIREVKSGYLIKFGAKGGWCTTNAAKNAFNMHMVHHFGKDWSEGKGLFDSQSEFIIEEVM